MESQKGSNSLTSNAEVIQRDASGERGSELWNSFRSGSRQALDFIFEEYAGLLFSYGRSMTVDKELIADCIQDVFFELWVKRESLAPEVKSVKYYLIKSVRTTLLRRMSVERRITGQRITGDYSEQSELNIEALLIQDQTARNLAEQLTASIKTLSAPQQEAIYLRFYERMSYEEIATVMNTSVKAVYSLVGRSITSLRKFFRAHPIVAG